MTEGIQVVYRPIELISPNVANRLGIETNGNRPVFTEIRPDNPPVYEVGSVVHAADYPIVGFHNLRAAIAFGSIGYFGAVAFSGFIAEIEPVGDFEVGTLSENFSDMCTRAQSMKVLGVKAFIEDEEVQSGVVREFIHFQTTPKLIMENGIANGRLRYYFQATPQGIIFEQAPDVTLRRDRI